MTTKLHYSNSDKWPHFIEKCFLCCNYFRYLHETNTTVVIIISNSINQISPFYTCQTFRLAVHSCPWRIKLHLGHSWSQLDGPTGPSENDFGIELRLYTKIHLPIGQTAMYLVSLESSLKLYENGVYSMLLSLILSALFMLQIWKYIFMPGHGQWICKLTHYFPRWWARRATWYVVLLLTELAHFTTLFTPQLTYTAACQPANK